MTPLRDYEQWHADYTDPDSALSQRLRIVQVHIAETLDSIDGPVRVLSLCAGEGRDVIEVLAGRPDAHRVTATLVEVLPAIADRARAGAAAAGLDDVRVVTGDAGDPAVYADAVPADLVLLVGIFGNITAADIERTLRAAPQFCAPDATLVWTRGDLEPDLRPQIMAWLAEAGFENGDLQTSETGRYGVGVAWYRGPEVALRTNEHLFTFVR